MVAIAVAHGKIANSRDNLQEIYEFSFELLSYYLKKYIQMECRHDFMIII